MDKELWWNSKEPHELIQGLVDHIQSNQEHREFSNLRHMRLYGNQNITGFNTQHYAREERTLGVQKERVRLNVVQSMVDTITAKIAKNRPKPMFLTRDGSYTLQRRAERKADFVETLFLKTDLYNIVPKVFRDACVFGSGFLKVYRVKDEIKVERIFPNEILVDDAESIWNDPQQLHQTKTINREVLKATFPKHKGKIEFAEAEKEFSQISITNMIPVVESWHLPSEKGGKDGRHTITIDGCTLLDESWTKDYFPFIKFDWSERLLGYYGQGLAEQLSGIQYEVNKLLIKIQDAFHLLAVPRVFLEYGSKVVKSHISNKVGSIVNYQGKPPVIHSPQTVHPEIFQHLDRLVQRAYEITGISQLSAQSKKPSGLNSGVALREYNDIETERFAIIGQKYENFFIKAAEQMMDLASEIAEEYGKFPVMVKSSKFIQEFDWSEVKLKDDEYLMQTYPISSLPDTPAGKLETVQEMISSGFIGQEDALSLLDFPDLEKVTSLKTASMDDIERVIEKMLDDGVYLPPEPIQDLQLGLQRIRSSYLKARLNGVEEERLQLLLDWLAQAQAMLQPPEQEVLPGPEQPPIQGAI